MRWLKYAQAVAAVARKNVDFLAMEKNRMIEMISLACHVVIVGLFSYLRDFDRNVND